MKAGHELGAQGGVCSLRHPVSGRYSQIHRQRIGYSNRNDSSKDNKSASQQKEQQACPARRLHKPNLDYECDIRITH